MWLRPLCLSSKAMRVPSGAQDGDPPWCSTASRRGLAPSASQSHIASVPSRVESNAILVPSGEKLGSLSVRVDAINLVSRSAESGIESFQIAMLKTAFSYASLSPRREIAGEEILESGRSKRAGLP